MQTITLYLLILLFYNLAELEQVLAELGRHLQEAFLLLLVEMAPNGLGSGQHRLRCLLAFFHQVFTRQVRQTQILHLVGEVVDLPDSVRQILMQRRHTVALVHVRIV